MDDYWLVATPSGCVQGADPRSQDFLRTACQSGKMVAVKAKAVRNPKFHRLIMALLRWSYEQVELPEIEIKGNRIKTSFDRFRKELVFHAGYYDYDCTLDGKVRVTPISISYDALSEEKAKELYQDLLETISHKLFSSSLLPEELNAKIEELGQFG